MPPKPFRFGVQGGATSRAEWFTLARRAEDLGYDVLLVPDHFPRGLGAVPALAAAAAVTERLRIGSFVLGNDFRHPALLAKDTVTLDLLSAGRFELGIGAGWFKEEYEATGIPFDPAPVRIARLAESVRLLKRLLAGEAVTASGDYYSVNDLAIEPRPVQTPRPPIMLAGGGPRILDLAAREADIVALGARGRPDGTLDVASITAEATARKVDAIRAAGDRWPELEINVFVYAVDLDADRDAAAERLAPDFELPAPDLLDSPHVLLGSPERIVETLHERRETFGISYVVVTQPLMEKLAPVIPLAAGR